MTVLNGKSGNISHFRVEKVEHFVLLFYAVSSIFPPLFFPFYSVFWKNIHLFQYIMQER